jgi:hypothetical protein
MKYQNPESILLTKSSKSSSSGSECQPKILKENQKRWISNSSRSMSLRTFFRVVHVSKIRHVMKQFFDLHKFSLLRYFSQDRSRIHNENMGRENNGKVRISEGQRTVS